MAFPEDPQGGPVPPSEPEQHIDETFDPDPYDPFPDEAGLRHVSGEIITDAAQTHLDETHSYSDDWSSSYSQPGVGAIAPPEPVAPPRAPGGSGKPPKPPEPIRRKKKKTACRA